MECWTTIPENDLDKIWDRFHKDFSFNPSINKRDWPSIKTEKPILKFDIKNLWGDSYNESFNDAFIQKAINAFIEVTSPEDKIFALDWQHECFYINPRQITVPMMTIPTSETGLPMISFIPDGDYYIFITKDFKNVWFGHPWEQSITIVGDNLIKAYNKANT